jgi:hypothetical protein
LKPAEVAATPWVFCWPRSLPAALAVAGPLLLVLAVYAQSVYRSPAFGQLADQGYHLAALESFTSAWSAGEFPPSWDADANGGRGSPGFVLYPPLFAFAGAALTRLGLEPVEALRVSCLLSVAALFGGVYYLAAGFASPARAGFGAAAACLLPGATFPSLARGMYPSFLALALFAVLLGALDRLARPAPRTVWRPWVALACTGGGLILTHTLTAYMTFCLLIVGAPRIIAALGRSGSRRAIGAALAALAATAWFWGPMLLTSVHAQTDFLAEAHPYARSLLGADVAVRTELERSWRDVNSIGTAFGAAQLLLAAALAWSLRQSSRTLSVSMLPISAVWIAAATVDPVGEWLTLVPGFDKLQFAWRWQGPLAVFCGAALAAIPERRLVLPGCLSALTVAGFLPLAQPADRPWPATNEATNTYSLAEAQELQPSERAAYLHNRIEMRPIGADRRYHPPGAPGQWEIVAGEARAAAENLSPSCRIYRIEAATPVKLRFLTYHFPGWRAWANGRGVAIQPETGSGLQIISLPAGTSRLVLRYSRFRF